MSCFTETSCGDRLDELLSQMRTHLVNEGKADATIEKYLRDAEKFIRYVTEQYEGAEGSCKLDICKDCDQDEGSCCHSIGPDSVRSYRSYLMNNYRMTSVNSMLAGVNYLLRCCGRDELRFRTYRIQRAAFREEDRNLTVDEYHRLVKTASEEGNDRLSMIMLTLGATGIRVSELPYITVEAVERGRADVHLKGAARSVIIPMTLCRRLESYARRSGISSGSIFVTRNGRPVDRSNILHDMKKLCRSAGVDPRKVHPHNFRHLFAVSYYDKYRDICHLADILGHSNINTTRIYTAKCRGEL